MANATVVMMILASTSAAVILIGAELTRQLIRFSSDSKYTGLT